MCGSLEINGTYQLLLGTIRKHGIDPEEEIMEWKLLESPEIFDHLFLERVFSAALPTSRGWKGLLSGRVGGMTPPSLCRRTVKAQG